jgi:acyl-CoA reductase-like NAD-dependent aldehyde dehydrogenase
MATDLHIAIRKIASVNPATGEVLREFVPAADAEVNAAVARARAAQPAWHTLGVRQRIDILDRFRQQLYEKKSEISRLITSETGKPLVEALLSEVLVVLDSARFYSENSYASLRDRAVPHGNLAMKTARALRRNRNHFPVELSVLHSGDGDSGRAGRWQHCRIETLGIHIDHRPGVGRPALDRRCA